MTRLQIRFIVKPRLTRWTYWELNPEHINANDALYRLTISPYFKTHLSLDELGTSSLKKGGLILEYQ